MAEIVDTLRLEIDQALRDVNQIEAALDRALAPVEVQVDIDKRSLQQLEDTLREVQRIADRAATETSSIALAAGNAEVNFEDIARALNISEEAARDLTREVIDAQAAANRLEDSARDVARQLGLSEDETRRFANSLQTAARHADDIDTRGRTLVGTFGSLRSAAAGVAGILAVIGGGQILSGAVRGVQTALTQFQALNESINAVNVTFGSAAQQVLDFGETSAQSAGLAASAFQQAVVPIGSVLTNFGFSAREAADSSIILVQRAADLASVFNTDVSEALLAINSALVGQVEPLRRYGAEISQARVENFALASGIISSKDELDEQARVAARVGLILADTARVQGDFKNTSDELANAQRIAAAEVQNFAAGVGEDLAPAMAELVGLLPQVLDGLQQLVPFLAQGADSAGAFFAALGQGGGMREEFATLGAVIGTATSGLGVLSSTSAGLFDLITGDVEGATDAFRDLGLVMDRNVIRPIAVDLARSLDRGTKSVDAVRVAIERIARLPLSFDAFTESFRNFAIQGNLTAEELFEVTEQLIDAGAAAGLSADEIAFLETQYALLRNTLFVVGNEAQQAARAMGETEGPFATITSRFTTFSGEIETAQQRSSAALAQLAADSEAQLQRAGAAFDLFGELPEQLEGTFADFVDNLQEQVTARVDFDINLAILRALGLDQLAAEFDEAGVAAATQLQEAVDNIPLAVEADRAARGFADDLAGTFEDELINRLRAIGISQSEAQQIADVLVSPQVIGAANAAATLLANEQTETYREQVIEELRQSADDLAGALDETGEAAFANRGVSWDSGGRDDAESYVEGFLSTNLPDQIEAIFEGLGIDIDLFDEGADARKTFFDGLSTKQAGEVGQVHDSITSTMDSAIFADSPPRLFLDYGVASADAFWSAFEAAATAPTIEPPEIRIPDIVLPDIVIPDVVLPDVQLSDITIPDVDVGTIDLTTTGVDAGASLIVGVTTGIASEVERLHAAIEDATNTALEARSPSQLMLRLGEAAGSDFWSGFNQADLTLKTPAPAFTGSIAGSTTAATNVVEGGFTFAPTVVNPTTPDLDTTLAQQGQIMAAIAGLLSRTGLR